jgi:hypothetical protein
MESAESPLSVARRESGPSLASQSGDFAPLPHRTPKRFARTRFFRRMGRPQKTSQTQRRVFLPPKARICTVLSLPLYES